MGFIEGVGDEVLFLFTVLVALTFMFLRILINKNRLVFSGELIENEDHDAPPAHNPNTCPICWNEQSLALQTNCGHLYCGQCLLSLYRQDSRMRCPMCRQNIRLLFIRFSNAERAEPAGSELSNIRTRVVSFARLHNHINNNESLSFLDRIYDIPVLLRHYYYEAINGHFADSYLQLRLYALIIFSIGYFLVPTDLIPEHIFGVIGFVDDIMLILIFAIYLAATYRNYISRGQEEIL